MDFLKTIAPFRSLFHFDEASLTAWGVLVLLGYFAISSVTLYLAVKKIARSLRRVMETFSAAAIASDDFLGEPWERYAHTFLVEDGRPRKTYEDAEDYFNEQSLIGARLNLRYWYAVPATLVGMGILGTFFGLTFGISSFGVDSTEMIRHSIATLLSGMSTAFVTSLWGMLLSIVFGWFEKWQFNSANAEINQLCLALNSEFKMTKVDELRLARDYQRTVFEQLFAVESENGGIRAPGAVLKDLHLEAIRQRTAQESLATELAGISASLTENLQNLAVYISDSARVLSSFPVQVDELMGTLSSQVHETKAISLASSETVQQNMERQAGDLQQLFSGLLTEVKQVISLQQDTIREISAQANENALAASRQVRQESEQSAKQFESMIQAFHGNFVEVLDRQQQNARVVDNLISGSTGFIDQSKELTRRVDTTIGNMDNVLRSMAVLSGQLMRSTELLKTSSDNLQNTTGHFEKHSDRMLNLSQKTLLHLESSLRRAEEVATDYANKFQVIQTGLNGIFSQIQDGLSEYQRNTRASLNEYLGQFSEQLAKAVQSLSGGIEELNGVFEEIADTKTRLN